MKYHHYHNASSPKEGDANYFRSIHVHTIYIYVTFTRHTYFRLSRLLVLFVLCSTSNSEVYGRECTTAYFSLREIIRLKCDFIFACATLRVFRSVFLKANLFTELTNMDTLIRCRSFKRTNCGRGRTRTCRSNKYDCDA